MLIWCSRIIYYYYQCKKRCCLIYLVFVEIYIFRILVTEFVTTSRKYHILNYMVLSGSSHKLSHTCTHVCSVCEVKSLWERGSSKETYNSILTEQIFPGGFLSVNSDYRTFKSCSALFNYCHPHPWDAL